MCFIDLKNHGMTFSLLHHNIYIYSSHLEHYRPSLRLLDPARSLHNYRITALRQVKILGVKLPKGRGKSSNRTIITCYRLFRHVYPKISAVRKMISADIL